MMHEKWCIALIRMDRPDEHESGFHVSLMSRKCNQILVQPALFHLITLFFIFSVRFKQNIVLYKSKKWNQHLFSVAAAFPM